MEKGLGTAVGGGFISLSESEQRCYSALCALCQADSSGKLQARKVAELFRASQLPAETLRQVTEVCGAPQRGYFSIGQFHVALKLLAAAQAGLPVCLDSIKCVLPLPRFSVIKYETDWVQGLSQHTDTKGPQFGSISGLVHRSVMERGTYRHPECNVPVEEPHAPQLSPRTSPPHSPSVYPRSTYDTQRTDMSMPMAHSTQGPGRLIGHQNNSSPRHEGMTLSPEHTTVARTYSVEGLVAYSIEDSTDDPWRITEEQWEYYTNQFKSLQPDLGALILGSVAKDFFTKSKLPIPELSHIWELSDMDRDGALTFSEFCAAFHLIVARKNGYSLPKTLPPSLRSSLTNQDRASLRCVSEDLLFVVPLAQLEKVPIISEKTEPLISFEDTVTIQKKEKRVETLHPLVENVTSKHDLEEEPSKSRALPKSPTEAQDSSRSVNSAVKESGLKNILDPNIKPRSRQRSYSSTSINNAVKNPDIPPAPPPRQQRTHSRASSLDLNKLFQQSNQEISNEWLPPPPALPPRPAVTQEKSAIENDEKRAQYKASVNSVDTEDTVTTKTEAGSSQQLPQKPVHRKQHLENQGVESTSSCFTASVSSIKLGQKLPSRQKQEIQTAIRKNRETNAVLARLNNELQQQLKEVHQERMVLESQLEILRPVAFV